MTCSTDGALVTIDSCALPGVHPDTITFKDGVCSAVLDEETNSFKISTGLNECGSELAFVDEKLTLQNTIKIGFSIIGGKRMSRKYEIDFGCKYNTVAEASAAIQFLDVMFDEISFDITAEQETAVSFEFGLTFYESGAFATQADLTNGAFQPGSPLFAKVTPPSVLSSVPIEFSVTRCTVEDKKINQSLDILDTCPVVGTSFEFKDSQSDQTAVMFSFKSFVFPTSDDNAVLDISCDVNICEKDSIACLNVCPVILILREDGSEPYVLRAVGSEAVMSYVTSNDTYIVGDKTISGWANFLHHGNKLRRVDNDPFGVYISFFDGFIGTAEGSYQFTLPSTQISSISVKAKSTIFDFGSVFWVIYLTLFCNSDFFKYFCTETSCTEFQKEHINEPDSWDEFVYNEPPVDSVVTIKVVMNAPGWWGNAQIFRQVLEDSYNVFDVRFIF